MYLPLLSADGTGIPEKGVQAVIWDDNISKICRPLQRKREPIIIIFLLLTKFYEITFRGDEGMSDYFEADII